MTDTTTEAVERCAECDCDHGGVYCDWMLSTPIEYKKELDRVTAERDELKAEVARLRTWGNEQRDLHTAYLKEAVEFRGKFGAVEAGMAAEKELADSLWSAWQYDGYAPDAVAAYRKARGL